MICAFGTKTVFVESMPRLDVRWMDTSHEDIGIASQVAEKKCSKSEPTGRC